MKKISIASLLSLPLLSSSLWAQEATSVEDFIEQYQRSVVEVKLTDPNAFVRVGNSESNPPCFTMTSSNETDRYARPHLDPNSPYIVNLTHQETSENCTKSVPPKNSPPLKLHYPLKLA